MPAILRQIVAACICTLAFAVTPAAAQTLTIPTGLEIGGAAAQEAVRIAEAHWAAVPCGGDFTLTWALMLPTVNAVSGWTNPEGLYGDPPENRDCQVMLNVAVGWSWRKFCTVVVHETGHLVGHEHVDDPADVMFYGYVSPVADCATAANPLAPATAVVAVQRPAKLTPKAKKRAKKRPRRTRSTAVRRRTR